MSIPGFAWALEQGAVLGLRATERLLLVYLADKANGIGVCWPGQDTIERFTGLADRTRRSATAKLVKVGLIKLEQSPGKATRYHIQRDLTPGNSAGGHTHGKTTGGNGQQPPAKQPGVPPAEMQGVAPAKEQGVVAEMQGVTPGSFASDPRQKGPRPPAKMPTEPYITKINLRGAREARQAKAENQSTQPAHVQPAPSTTPSHLVPSPAYASPDEARATFAAFLAAKRRETHGEPEQPVLEARAPARAVKRAAAATIYALRKYAPAVGAKPERSRDEQLEQLAHPEAPVGEILLRPPPAEPVRSVAEQLAALGYPQLAAGASP